MKKFFCYSVLGLIALATLWSCQAEEQPPASCTRVYVYIEDENPRLREYEQFFVRQQEYGYYASQYAIFEDSVEYVYQFDKNIFIDRRDDYLEVKGAITFDSYVTHCSESWSPTDTVYVIVDKEGGGFREFLARERYALIRRGDKLIKDEPGKEDVLLVDYGMAVGSWSAPGTMRIKLQERDDVYCTEVVTIRRQIGLIDSTNESYLHGHGLSYHNDGKSEIRLHLIDGKPWLAYVEAECE